MSVEQIDGDLPHDVGQAIRKAGRVAIDTETSGLDWSTDALQLCQLHTSLDGTFLLRNVDTQPRELTAVLLDPSIVKVFHFAPFDLRFLRARWQLTVSNVACTKAASRLLDPELPAQAHSLQALLERHLGVRIGKGSVRTSDWGAPNLSAEQVDYAAADVTYLLDLVDTLQIKLAKLDRSDLFARVCAYMPTAAELEVRGVPNPLEY